MGKWGSLVDNKIFFDFHKLTQSMDDWNEYKKARNRVTAEIRKAKREYITNTIKISNGQTGNMEIVTLCDAKQK